MRNAFSALCVALTLAGLVTPAAADWRGPRPGYGYHNHGGYGYRGGGDNWVAPLVGGLIIGGMVGALSNQPRYYSSAPVVIEQYPPQETCRNMVTHYDRYGRPIVQLVCGYDEE